MRALLLLTWLHTRATLRRSVRGARTLKGAAFLALGIFVLILWLGPALAGAFLAPRADPQKTLDVMPLILLAMCVSNLVTSVGERAVAFAPPEVDLLFAGPFTRRQLLLYKLTRSAVAAGGVAALFSVMVLRYTQLWLAGFVGIFLSLMLLQLLGMTVVLVGQSIGGRAYTRARKLAPVLILVVAAALLAPHLRRPEGSLPEIASRLRDAPAARVVLAPFAVFAHVVAARSIPEMLRWAAAALGVLGALLALVLWLDAQYLELSAAAGQRLYERVRHVRRTGTAHLRAAPGAARLRVPMLPRCGGAGPIAWRQLTAALRQSRALLTLLLLVALAAGPGMYVGGIDAAAPRVSVLLIAWLTVMLANSLRFDFRGDVDHIDVLKALPVAPAAVVVGQLVAPVAVMSVLQLALLSGLYAIVGLSARFVVAAAVLALPFNGLMFAVENLIFLLFPGRWAAGPGDLQGFGRQMVVFLLKTLALLLAVAVAGAGAAGAYWLTRSPAAALAVGAVLLWAEAIALIPAVVLAYVKYDVSADTPV